MSKRNWGASVGQIAALVNGVVAVGAIATDSPRQPDSPVVVEVHDGAGESWRADFVE